MEKQQLYRVSFLNHGQIYELYARTVDNTGMFGFVEIGDLVFGEHTAVVIDPSEEKLKDEFADVTSFYVPMQAIIRIDVVSRQGTAKIREADGKGGNVAPFPGMFTPPGKG